jgi:hypothetical protein
MNKVKNIYKNNSAYNRLVIEARPSMQKIFDIAIIYFKIDPHKLNGLNVKSKRDDSRYIMIYIMLSFKYTQEQIKSFLNYRERTSICFAKKTITNLLTNNEEVISKVNNFNNFFINYRVK